MKYKKFYLVIFCSLLFFTFLNLDTPRAFAATTTCSGTTCCSMGVCFDYDHSGCYTNDPVYGSTGLTTLTLAKSTLRKTVSIINSTPASLFQRLTFTSPDYNCALFAIDTYYRVERIKADFVTPLGLMDFPNSSAWPVPGERFLYYSTPSAIASVAIPANPDTVPSFYSWNYLTRVTYMGLTDLSLPMSIANEDAILNNIDTSHTLNLRFRLIYTNGSIAEPSFVNLSAPATNCVKLSGTGAQKVVITRSNKQASINDFMWQATDLRDAMIKAVSTPSQYSFYVDLKKRDQATFVPAQSSCVTGFTGAQYVFIGNPSNLTATMSTTNIGQVQLSWTGVANVTGYQIERAVDKDSVIFQPVATVAANLTSYTDDLNTASLLGNKDSYRIRAVYTGGTFSNYTNIAQVSNCIALSGVGSQKIILTRSNEFTSIKDFLSSATGFRDQMFNEKPYSDSPGLYSFYVDILKQFTNPYDLTSGAAVSSCGSGALEYRYIVPVPVITKILAARSRDLTNNIRPGGIIYIFGSGFTASEISGIGAVSRQKNKLQIINATDSSLVYEQNNVDSPTGTTIDFTFPPSIQTGSYYIQIRAFNSVWSNQSAVNVADSGPTNLVATAPNKGTVNLKWDPDPSIGMGVYAIEKKYPTDFSQITLIGSPNWSYDTYSPSVTATFRVRSCYENCASYDPTSGTHSTSYTNEATVTTLPKTKPPILIATAGQNASIILSWINFDSVDVTKYTIADLTNNVDLPGDLSQTYTLTGLTSGTQYCFSVIAIVNDNNKSDSSNVDCVTADSSIQQGSINSSDPTTSIIGTDTINLSTTDSTVSSVDLFVNGTKVGTDTMAPWSINFDSTNFPNGSGQIYFIIYHPLKPPTSTIPIPVNIRNPGTGIGAGTTLFPSVILSVTPTSITSGQSSNVSWTSINTTSCTASGAWTGTKATSGTLSVTPTANSTYNLTCTGAGGTNSIVSATVTVTALPPSVSCTISTPTVTGSGPYTVKVPVTSTVGLMGNYELYRNNIKVDSTSAIIANRSYNFTDSNISAGTYTYTVAGIGLTAPKCSPAQTVTVGTGVVTPPKTSTPVTVLPWTAVTSVQAGQPLTYTLNWSGGPLDKSWRVFAHMIKDDNSHIFTGGDFLPNPTTLNWTGNIVTTNTITIPAGTPPGTYKVMVGLYDGAPRVQNLIDGGGVTSDTQYRHQVGTVTVAELKPQILKQGASIWDAVRGLFGRLFGF